MGTYAEYSGKFKIAEHKKEEYVTNMLTILNYGGMMHLDEVNMYGKKLMLISPLILDTNNWVKFRYNYFEDDAWETAEFDANRCQLWTQKIGSSEFANTISAAYVLQELYDEEPGVAMVNGKPLSYFYVAWISQLLGMEFTMERRFRLWECVESNYLYELERGYSESVDFEYVMKLVPTNLRRAMGGVEFADIFLMCKGTKELEKTDILPGTYPEMMLKCKEALLKYINDGKAEKREKINAIRSLVKSIQGERQKIKGELEEVAKLSLKLAAKVIVYLLSEVCDLKFWEEWKEIRDECYSDEEVSSYASVELSEWRKKKQKKRFRR